MGELTTCLVPLSTSGDVAAWVGAGATVLLGVIAAAIAWMQFTHSKFNPSEYAAFDKAGRILVRVVNEGSGSGTVENVRLLGTLNDGRVVALAYRWEIEGAKSMDRPLPFPLAGGGVAQLFLLPHPREDTSNAKVEVSYGDKSRSKPLVLRPVDGRLVGTTTITGITP